MCGFGKTSEKEERVKMQKADAKSGAKCFFHLLLQKLSELSLSVGIGVCQMSDEFFFLQNEACPVYKEECSPLPGMYCLLRQGSLSSPSSYQF